MYVFPDNCRYFSLMLHQNITNGSFLKVTFTGIWTYDYELVAVCDTKTHWTYWILNGHFIHAWSCNIIHWSLGKCWFFGLWKICVMLTHFIIQKKHLLVFSSEKYLSSGKCQVRVVDTRTYLYFQNSNVCSYAQMLSHFPSSVRLTYFIFEKMYENN